MMEDDPQHDELETEDAPQVSVPWDALSENALRAVIEEFVTREGTEYGEHDVPLDRKVEQVRRQLEHGDVVVLFDGDSKTVNLVRAADVPVR